MVQFTTTLLQFAEQGEKTGWTYIAVSAEIAAQLKPGSKKSFRVKGWLDGYAIKQVALIPMGQGDFIMAINATMRKGLKKRKGDKVLVKIALDETAIAPPPEMMECLEYEPAALAYFNSLAQSHQLYFTKWVTSAKTDETKTKRIAHAVNALARRLDYGQMIRLIKQQRKDLMGT